MATLLNSSTFSGSVGGNFKLNLYYDYSQNTSGNYTDITYYLYFQSLNTYSGSGSAVNGYINDTWVGSTNSIGRNEEKLIGTKAVNVPHNNDGTFPGSAYNASLTCPWNGVGNASVSGTLTGLPTIPRNFSQTPTITLVAKTETSYTFNWSTSETCNWIRYHFDGSAGWHDVFASSATSGSFTVNNGDSIYGDSSGTVNIGVNTTHSIYAECRRQDSGLWLNSNTVTDTTYDYPKPTSVSSNVITGPFDIFVSNPCGRTYTLDLISNVNGANIGSYTGTINGDVVGFDDPTSLAARYASIPNAQRGTYYARVTYGTSVKTLGNGTYEIKYDEKPTVTTTALDTNKTLVNGNTPTLTIQDLTNDTTNKTIIKYISDVAVSVSATSNYSATITSYGTKCGGNAVISGTPHTYENVDNATFRGYANDSRQLQGTSLAQGLTLIDYIKLTLEDVELYRDDQTSSTLKCKGHGNYTNAFGTNGANNSLVLKLRWYENGDWTAWQTKTVSIGTDSYSFDFTVGSTFDYTKTYNFQFEVADKCMTVTDSKVAKAGIPVQGLFETYHEAFGVKTFEKDNNGNISLDESVMIPNNFKYKTLTTGSNIDNLSEEGVFAIYNATGTLPSGYSTSDNNMFIQNMLWGDGSWGRQVLYDIRTNEIYARPKSQGTWYGWDKINNADVISQSGNNNYLNINTKITDNAYYDINLDRLGKNTRFSTDELVIGQFFDGKPIYRKCFYGTFSHNQTILSNIDVLVRAYGEGDPGTGSFRQIPYFEYWNGNSYFCNVVHDSTNHALIVNSYLANSPHNCSMIITVEYTKTTD